MYKLSFVIFILAAAFIFFSCGGEEVKKEQPQDIGDIAFTPYRDKEIQRYNLKVRKERSVSRTPCDTIALIEHVIGSFPDGTYLVTTDPSGTYDIPQPAVIYYQQEYIFAVIARSRPGERLIDTKNIIGFDESYIDYDSTKLGTAFFDLVLFHCDGKTFSVVWEAPIPSHGGFNNIGLGMWKNTPRITVNFYNAHKKGAIDYNYYLINSLREPPHLLMTYSGINFRRTEADINKDQYPDYYEHIFYDTEDRIIRGDSAAFVWKPENNVYMSITNRKQTRPY